MGLAAACLAALAGALSALYANEFGLLIILLSIIVSPLLLVLGMRAPELAGGTLVFLLILEAFEVATPVGSISIGIVILVVFLVVHLRGILHLMNRSRFLIVLGLILALLILANTFQILHVGPDTVLRRLVTLLSFAIYWFVGIKLGSEARYIRSTVIGATLALLVLGTLGILASSNVIPPPTRIVEPRAFFGFVSPFRRNYGLDLNFAGVALLLPLCAPWIFGQAVFARTGITRVLALITYALLIMVVLLVFQSRSMILELIVVPAIIIAYSNARTILRFTFIAVGIGAVYLVLPNLLMADEGVGSGYRSDSFAYIVEYLKTNPKTFLIGANVNEIRMQVERFSAYTQLVGEAPIHNMFVGQLLQGGALAMGSLALLFAIPILRVRNLLSSGAENRQVGSVVLASLGAAFIEIMINPIEANVAGLWLTLGIAASVIGPANQQSSIPWVYGSAKRLNPRANTLLGEVSYRGMM